MKNSIFKFCLGLVVLCMAASVYAEVQTFEYHTRNPRTRKDINTYTLTIEQMGEGRLKYARRTTGPKIDQVEQFILDEDFETVEWSTQRKDEETDYSGRKDGRTISVKGVLKGKPIDKNMDLEDDGPFYFSPKFNLQQLILSDKEEVRFWTLRKDELTPVQMVAKKDGLKTLKIGGKEVETVKIKYSPTGKFAKYYRRTYYYRVTDGFFVYRKSPTGSITQLVGP